MVAVIAGTCWISYSSVKNRNSGGNSGGRGGAFGGMGASKGKGGFGARKGGFGICLLYTSDAADE